jgi:ABC-type multidrug transport system permease subunit
MSVFENLWNWFWNQVRPVAYKEFIHMLNDPSTMRIAIILPLLQIVLFGYAINMDVENVPTVVFNEDLRPAATQLLQGLENTRYFKIKDTVYSRDAVLNAIRTGKAQVGIIIPPNYSDNVALGQKASFQVLIDGSESNTATQALSVVNQYGAVVSRVITEDQSVGSLPVEQPVETVPYVLYNPDLKTTFLTIPGLLGIVLNNVVLFLTIFSLAREREQGTMDQLLVTPLRPSGLVVGKMFPYVMLGFLDFNLVLVVMILIFKVPVAGSILLLEFCAFLFLLSVLGLGLLISARSTNQMQAAQVSQLVVLPSILLSGFVFSIHAMPQVIQFVSYSLPMTYFIMILRAIILRGAGFMDLLFPMMMLTLLGAAILLASIITFKRRMS